jgi:hypothetical protein
MLDQLKKILTSFNIKDFLIYQIYFLLFFLVSTMVHPAHKYVLVLAGTLLLFLKLLGLWAYNGENLKTIRISIKYKEFLALLILIFYFFDGLIYLYNDFGILNITIYIILFLAVCFISLKENSIKTSKETKHLKITDKY